MSGARRVQQNLAPWAARRRIRLMNITVSIPDALAAKLGAEADLPRRVLEALLLEEYRLGRLTRPELRGALGFGTRFELDGFLKDRGVNEGMTVAEFERDRDTLERLGV